MRITGRQLRQIIQEEVERMMSEEDAAPGLFGGDMKGGTIGGGGPMPVSMDRPEVRKYYVSAPATPEEMNDAYAETIAEGRISTIPGVSAIEMNRKQSAPKKTAYYIPLNFGTGVFTFDVALAKETNAGLRPPDMGVKVIRPLAATIDGVPSPNAAAALVGSDQLVGDFYASRTNTTGRDVFTGMAPGEKPTSAKMTLVVSSREATFEERNKPNTGIRKLTVQSVKFESAGSAAAPARKR